MSSLDIAARSMLDSHVAGSSVASVVADRALDHLWDGLFQHVALRVGPVHGTELLTRLEQEMESALGRTTGTLPVDGPRVELYRRIRAFMGAEAPELPTAESSVWWTPADSSYRRKLFELRRALMNTLSRKQLEIVELHFARSLSVVEVAALLEVSHAEVEHVSADALGIAERWLGRRPASRDHTLAGALLESLVVDPLGMRAPRRRRHRPVLALGTLIGARYEVEGLLGAGAFADVYRARDREVTDHVVALKILRVPAADESSVRVALRELQLIASVFHPSVVQLKDHGWHERHLWFVMPLYRGETLASRVQRAALSRREAREIFEPLAEALATMHRAGVLHQDIKPDNVFLANLDPETTDAAATGDHGATAPRRILPVLLDLGVAAKDAELVLAGTPAYFAPEVAARFAGAADPAPVGPKADLFSLSLTLRHALDPRPREELPGASVDAFVAYRAQHAPAAPTRRDLHDLRGVFGSWLHFSPDQRPSAEEFRRQLAALTFPEERRTRRIALLRWAVPTAVALVALFGVVVYSLSREASVQRVQAVAARERAEQAGKRVERVSASLTVQQAKRRELEADVARLRTEYNSSRMTREQLASGLAQAESQLSELNDRQLKDTQRLRQQADELRKEQQERARVAAELGQLSARRDELANRLERANGALDAERVRRAELETRSQRVQEQLDAAMLKARQADQRADQLEARWDVLRLINPNSVPSASAP